MIGDLGFYLLFLCCICAAYGLIASLAAAGLRHRRLYRSARLAATAVTVLIIAAAVILWYGFFTRDYSIAYIWRNSSNDLPKIYTFSAFWSAMEGSHFLWTLLLSIYTTIALWTAVRDNEHIMPYVCASLLAVLTWMLYMSVSYSDPFVLQFPIHDNGLGKNPLLQHPYMAIHPPTLFTGYTALAIPAAYAIAALAYGDVTEGWLKTTRRWALFAWCFLTAGIALGGRWAYVELGWAGYWAWDPVENSSFMPWLLTTALLHALLVQEKLGHLKRLTIVLAVLAFFMSFFGTFITRSGIITSVHSFADGNIGPNYLVFLSSLLGFSALLYGFRAHSILPAETDKVWGVSKESALVVTQFLLLSFAAIILIGTVFPIVSEAVSGQRISIQAPYFNAFAPWIGLGAIIGIAIGNLLRYHTGKLAGGARTLGMSALYALPISVILIRMADVLSTPKPFALGAQIVGIFLCVWSAGCLFADVRFRLLDLRWNLKLFFQRNLAYFGAFIAHIGFIVAIFGFLGNYRGVDTQATLKQGERSELYGYAFTFKGMDVREAENATLFEAEIEVSRDGKTLATMHPGKSRYPTKAELMNEVALESGFWHDLYIVLADFDKTTGKQVTLQIHVNPTVRLVWISIMLMVFGGLLAILDRVRGTRSKDVMAPRWDGATTAGGVGAHS